MFLRKHIQIAAGIPASLLMLSLAQRWHGCHALALRSGAYLASVLMPDNVQGDPGSHRLRGSGRVGAICRTTLGSETLAFLALSRRDREIGVFGEFARCDR